MYCYTQSPMFCPKRKNGSVCERDEFEYENYHKALLMLHKLEQAPDLYVYIVPA